MPSAPALPLAAPLARPSRPEPRGLVGTGERLRSRSGRAMAPVPALNLSTDRTTLNSLVRLRGWLLDEARAEATATGNGFHTTLLKGLDARKLSPCDLASLNLMLFDHDDGPGPEHRTSSETATA